MSEESATSFINGMDSEIRKDWGYGDVLDRAKQNAEDALMSPSGGGMFNISIERKRERWDQVPDAK